MKNLLILVLIGIVLLSSIPSCAAGNVFTAIPESYYVPLLAGAAIQGLLLSNGVAPMQSLYITVGLGIAKEVIASTVFKSDFNWENAGSTALGAGFVFYL